MNADAGLVAYQASGRLRQIRRFNQLAIVFFMYPPSQHLQNQLVICPYISLHKVCEILVSTGERVLGHIPNAVAQCRSASMKVGFAFLAKITIVIHRLEWLNHCQYIPTIAL